MADAQHQATVARQLLEQGGALLLEGGEAVVEDQHRAAHGQGRRAGHAEGRVLRVFLADGGALETEDPGSATMQNRGPISERRKGFEL